VLRQTIHFFSLSSIPEARRCFHGCNAGIALDARSQGLQAPGRRIPGQLDVHILVSSLLLKAGFSRRGNASLGMLSPYMAA
jgi:hypothetical protein